MPYFLDTHMRSGAEARIGTMHTKMATRQEAAPLLPTATRGPVAYQGYAGPGPSLNQGRGRNFSGARELSGGGVRPGGEMLQVRTVPSEGTGCSVFTVNQLEPYSWRSLGSVSEQLNAEMGRRHEYTSRVHEYTPVVPNVARMPTPVELDSSLLGRFSEVDGQRVDIRVAVCIPCYDESWFEIGGTLRSLASSILAWTRRTGQATDPLSIVLVIIQDGWMKASPSLKAMLPLLGCPTETWMEENIPSLRNGNVEEAAIVLPEEPVWLDTSEDPNAAKISVVPIFVTKSKNKLKLNSHLLFFSLCNIYKPDVVFLTDAGTTYALDCFTRLLSTLLSRSDELIAVTARQRVMGPYERRAVQDPQEYNTLFKKIASVIGWWISPAPLQGFEFESTFLLNAQFNLLGALPVLPGPCQMFIWDYIAAPHGPLDAYFQILTPDARNDGLVKLNMALAEDRVLTFKSLMLSMGLRVEWVRGATFHYEAMDSWRMLLAQRKRWNNGTAAAFLFFLFSRDGLLDIPTSGLEHPRIVQLMWGMQLLQVILVLLSPAFFSCALYESVHYLTVNVFKSGVNTRVFGQPLSFAIAGIYFITYVLWIFFSMTMGKAPAWGCLQPNTKRFIYNSLTTAYYNSMYLVNVAVQGVIMTALVSSVVVANTNANPDDLTPSNVNLFFKITVVVWCIPIVLACTVSFRSAVRCLLYLPAFLISLSMYVCFIPAAALARMHDLSWGNRNSALDVGGKEREFLAKSIVTNLFAILLNLGILASYTSLVETYHHPRWLMIVFICIIFIPMIVQTVAAAVYVLSAILGLVLRCAISWLCGIWRVASAPPSRPRVEEVHEYYDAAPAVAVPSPRGAGGGAREGRVGGVGGPYVNLSVDSRRRIASILATRRR